MKKSFSLKKKDKAKSDKEDSSIKSAAPNTTATKDSSEKKKSFSIKKKAKAEKRRSISNSEATPKTATKIDHQTTFSTTSSSCERASFVIVIQQHKSNVM